LLILFVKNVNSIKITKVKPWAVYFNADGKHYLLHGSNVDDECTQTIFERTFDENGVWKLNAIQSRFGDAYLSDEYVGRQNGKTVVYR
jgi:hypothetical protein